MTLPDIYAYLIRSRRELWSALEQVPDDVLARPLAGEAWFPCLKDLIFHIITVEDGWLHLDILREEPVLTTFPTLQDAEEGAACSLPLEALLAYWRAVETSTSSYLSTLTDLELGRVTTPHDDPEPQRHFAVDGLLWHAMIHEMRHTAQIAVLLRAQGITPPALDLLWYLPDANS